MNSRKPSCRFEVFSETEFRHGSFSEIQEARTEKGGGPKAASSSWTQVLAEKGSG
jgi:hypothetical protein